MEDSVLEDGRGFSHRREAEHVDHVAYGHGRVLRR